MGSSRPRDGTHVSCAGRQILRHWTTREARESSVEIVAQGIHEDCERTSHTAPFSFPLWPGTLAHWEEPFIETLMLQKINLAEEVT